MQPSAHAPQPFVPGRPRDRRRGSGAGGARVQGHHQIQTTQKYLHALPDTDQKNLDALDRMSRGDSS
jgi:hypothetical protein